ncbi:MAG: hypothetical protein ACTSSL_04470 [Candidatus Heimdallarchaeaceae archaeon]
MEFDITKFQRLVIRVELDKPIMFTNYKFSSSLLKLWSDFLNMDLTTNHILVSSFIPVTNNFNYYSGKETSQKLFDLNITYSNIDVQQSFIEKILLGNSQTFFASKKLTIDRIFMHKTPSLNSLSSIENQLVTFYFNCPSFVINGVKGTNKVPSISFPSLDSILHSLFFRLNLILSDIDFSSLLLTLDLEQLNYSLNGYNIRSHSSQEGVSCLGNVSYFFEFIPRELVFVFSLVNVFGLGLYPDKGYGWINVNLKEFKRLN